MRIGNRSGFTLVELAVTMAVLAILATLAAPSFIELMNRSRLGSQANEIVAGLQFARMEAIRRNEPVRFSPVMGSGSFAWKSWQVTNRDGREVLRVGTVGKSLQVTGLSGAGLGTVFRPDGMANVPGSGSDSTVTVCMATTRPQENQRLINIGFGGGRVSTSLASGAGACP